MDILEIFSKSFGKMYIRGRRSVTRKYYFRNTFC